ncbi:MAG: hypothetical protein ACYC5H_17275 [Methylovirgula sp.]
MLSSLNSYGGLSSAELLTLFGANSSSSSASSASASKAQSPSTGVSGSSSNDPAKAIQAILAQAQIDQAQTATLGGGWTLSATEAAYASEAGGSSSLLSANVTISSPDAVQQINNAVSEINRAGIYAQDAAPPNNFGILGYQDPVKVTAADAVNVTIGNGGVSLTATQSAAALEAGLPSLTTIQQAISTLNEANGGTPLSSPYEGSFTLVKLPPNTLSANGENMALLGTFGKDAWALVLPQDTVTVTVSQTQTTGSGTQSQPQTTASDTPIKS